MAKNDFYGGKPMTFLNIDFKECAWYQQADKKSYTQMDKEQNEREIAALEASGYKRKESVNPKTNEASVSYRKYYRSVSGFITGVKIEDGAYGQVLKIYVEDETETNVLNINMFSQSNSLTGYVVDFIRHTGNIPLDEKIEIGINKKLKNDKDKVLQLLTICYEERTNQNGKELMRRAISKDDMPSIEPYKLAGKDMFNTTKRDEFLCNVLEGFIKNVSENHVRMGQYNPGGSGNVDNAGVNPSSSAVNATTVSPQPVPTPNPNNNYSAPTQAANDYDDLPF